MLVTGTSSTPPRRSAAGWSIGRCPEALDEEVARLTASICAKSPVAIAMGKQMFYSQLEMVSRRRLPATFRGDGLQHDAMTRPRASTLSWPSASRCGPASKPPRGGPPGAIDTHCHLDAAEFDADREALDVARPWAGRLSGLARGPPTSTRQPPWSACIPDCRHALASTRCTRAAGLRGRP